MSKDGYWTKRIAIDVLFAFFSISPCVASYLLDAHGLTKDLFLRSGAIMVLFAAFLEFRTYQIQIFREHDNTVSVWRALETVVEGLVRVDSANKYVLRSISNLISSAGMKPDIGTADQIKDIVLSDGIKALKELPNVPNMFYKYTTVVSVFGKVLVILGTIVWAFGDLLAKAVR